MHKEGRRYMEKAACINNLLTKMVPNFADSANILPNVISGQGANSFCTFL